MATDVSHVCVYKKYDCHTFAMACFFKVMYVLQNCPKIYCIVLHCPTFSFINLTDTMYMEFEKIWIML